MNFVEIAVIIPNWNGWEDTCECLASLYNSSYKNFICIIIDNGSIDNSVDNISEWASIKKTISYGPYQEIVNKPAQKVRTGFKDDFISKEISSDELILIVNDENLGFAKACNQGISFAESHDIPYIFILNNDTTVEEHTLNVLLSRLQENSDIPIVSPQINFYDQPETIWSFGGKIQLFGRRQFLYHCQNQRMVQLPKQMDVDFITGCAMMVKSQIFRQHGMFTEKFFFGEEDYDFALRMKKLCIKMAVTSDALVYHKVGVSNKKFFSQDYLPYIFIGYLNRMINLKYHLTSIIWWIQFSICIGYIYVKLISHGVPGKMLNKFMKHYIVIAKTEYNVSRELFIKARELFKK